MTLQRSGMAAACIALAALGAMAADVPPSLSAAQLEARTQKISAGLRCLVCQNQTIADSSADLAVDLRGQVRQMLRQGKSEREIYDYMTARYGDFILYRPPMKETTLLLWFGPGVVLAGGLAALMLVMRRRGRLAPADFESDDSEFLGSDNEPANPPPR